MKNWLLLFGAILFEVIGTLTLRASIDNKWWIPIIVVAYLAAFLLLGLALAAGTRVGVAYGIWGASGVALVALFGALIFGEMLSPLTLTGIVIVIAGVFIVQTAAEPSVTGLGEEQ